MINSEETMAGTGGERSGYIFTKPRNVRCREGKIGDDLTY
jgi:hypothetical protein